MEEVDISYCLTHKCDKCRYYDNCFAEEERECLRSKTDTYISQEEI